MTRALVWGAMPRRKTAGVWAVAATLHNVSARLKKMRRERGGNCMENLISIERQLSLWMSSCRLAHDRFY
jgi:hypothetical protein